MRQRDGVAQRDEWTGIERDSAGIRLVHNPPRGIWTEATNWIVERDLSIGTVDGAPEYLFGRVVDVDVDSNGRVYVLDQQAAQVRVFDPGGSYVYSFGGPGEGPGELSDANPLGVQAAQVARSGEVYVLDRGNGRVSRFSTAGRFVDLFSLHVEEGEPVASSILPTGNYVIHRVRRSAPRWNGLLQIGPDGEVVDTILDFPFQPDPWGMSPPTPQGRRRALAHSPLWAILPDGRIVSGISNAFRIEVRTMNGDLETIIEGDNEPLALSRQEQEMYLDRLLELWAEMFRARGDPEDRIQSQLRQGRDVYILPERLPAFTGFAGGPDGTIWVRSVLPIQEMTAHILGPRPPLREFWASDWNVFSRAGRFLGEVGLPSRFTLFKIQDHYIYGVEQDDFGVQHVVRLRIVKPESEGAETDENANH